MASKNDNINSNIGEGSIFEGKFHIHGSLQIDGKFEGEIHTNDSLFIGENGKVKTNVFARKVVISGSLIGNIEATEEVILLETAKVLGNISAPIINIHQGAITQGKVTITSNQGREVEKLIQSDFESIPSIDQLNTNTATNIDINMIKKVEKPDKVK